MKKLFISQPMNGLTDEEILKAREIAKMCAEISLGESLELIDSFIEDYPDESVKNTPVWFLGKSIQLLSEADVVYFAEGWRNARGCKLEFAIASTYDIKIITED